MKNESLSERLPLWARLAICALLAFGALACMHFNVVRGMALVSGIVMVLLLAMGDIARLRRWPAIFLLGYAAFSMVTLFWALAGKFVLQQYPKILAAATIFVAVVLYERPGRGYARAVMGVSAGVSTAYAVIELVCAGIPALSEAVQGFFTAYGGFQYADRLSGVLANANIEAAIHALGVFFAIALLCDATKEEQRLLWAVSLYLNAAALLLGASLGALFFFALSIPVYLIFAGKGRSAALARMLCAAGLAVVTGALMIHFYGADQGGIAIVLMILGCAAAAALELKMTDKLSNAFARKEKLTFGTLVVVIVLAVVYLIAAVNISGPYTFGSTLSRSVDIGPGEHVLAVEADGPVSVRVTYYVEGRLMADPEEAYEGFADGARFALPEDVASVYLVFDAGEGVTLSKATVDDGTTVILRYAIMVPFLANRLGGTGLSSDVLQRFTYYRDSWKLIKSSPIIGYGVGSLETALTSVQDYPYEVRYIHNHYLQILVEDGIIGFVLFMAALVSMGVALWKKRKQAEENESFWLYPALCAEFVMVLLHMLWDVFMSYLVPLTMIYAMYGLITSLYAEPIPAKEEAAKKSAKATAVSDAPVRVALCVLPVFFVVSICGNIYAQHELSAPKSSVEAIYASMERTVRLDLYEKNDIMVSYLVTLMNRGEMDDHASKANEYAEKLSKVHSNAIPAYLVMYYFNTGQYEKTIDEAMLGATYSLSDARQWNTIADYLKQGFIDSSWASPLLNESRGNDLLDRLLEYKAVLDGFNAQTVRPLELNDNSMEFFDKVEALDTVRGDYVAMVGVMTA